MWVFLGYVLQQRKRDEADLTRRLSLLEPEVRDRLLQEHPRPDQDHVLSSYVDMELNKSAG